MAFLRKMKENLTRFFVKIDIPEGPAQTLSEASFLILFFATVSILISPILGVLLAAFPFVKTLKKISDKTWADQIENSIRLGSLSLFILFGCGASIMTLSSQVATSPQSEATNDRQDPVYNSPWDGSVFGVKYFLKENLNDPDSLDFVEWTKVIPQYDPPNTYRVAVKYRARNAFGGYVLKNQLFYLSSESRVYKVEDVEDLNGYIK